MNTEQIKQELHDLINNLDVDEASKSTSSTYSIIEYVKRYLNASQKPKEKTLKQKLIDAGFEYNNLATEVFYKNGKNGKKYTYGLRAGFRFTVFTHHTIQLEVIINYDTKKVIITDKQFKHSDAVSYLVYSIDEHDKILEGIVFLESMVK